MIKSHDSTHREVESLAIDRAFLDLLFLDQGFQQSEAEPLTRVVVANGSTYIAVPYTLRVVVQELDDALFENVIRDECCSRPDNVVGVELVFGDGRGHVIR